MANFIRKGEFLKFLQNANHRFNLNGNSARFSQSVFERSKATAVPLQETWDDSKPKASTAAEGSSPTPFDVEDPAFENIDLSFENFEVAFKSKSNIQLLRSLLVFNLCSVPVFVNKNKELMKVGRSILGKRLFEKVMEGTFYGQFVAGEDVNSIQPVIHQNLSYGVKSILDYSVEKDLSREEAKKREMESFPEEIRHTDGLPGDEEVQFHAHEEFGDRRELVTSARTYFYEDEAQCDQNMEIFLKCIDSVSGATNATGFAAIKLTALGRPQLLLQLSEVLVRVRRHYELLAQTSGNVRGNIEKRDFGRYLKRMILDREERKRWYTVLDLTQDGEIDMLDWFNLLEVNISLAKLLRVPNTQNPLVQTGQFEPLVSALTTDEEEQMKNMLHRIDTIVRYGKEKDVRVMVDAEQTYFQPAITRLTMEMMRKFNTEKAIVFNTYQCYLKEAFSQVTTDLALSQRENFFFGAKLVRGAYMEQERLRSTTLGYEDPINPSYEATSQMYEKVLVEVMRQIQVRERGEIAVMIASHNEDSVRFAVNKMKEYGIRASDRVICFGQLLGMCDQLSFSLGQAGYSVYKYVPYGPVEEVLPYLSRRAVENQGILAKVKKEKRLLRQELWRRFKTFQWFYRPPKGPITHMHIPDTRPATP